MVSMPLMGFFFGFIFMDFSNLCSFVLDGFDLTHQCGWNFSIGYGVNTKSVLHVNKINDCPKLSAVYCKLLNSGDFFMWCLMIWFLLILIQILCSFGGWHVEFSYGL